MTVRSNPASPSSPRPRRPATAKRTVHARRRGAPASLRQIATAQLASSDARSPGRDEEGSRWNRGDFLLLVFFAATLIMVVAVVLVGAVGQWWVLVPVMVVDLTATFVVLASLVQLLGDDGKPSR